MVAVVQNHGWWVPAEQIVALTVCKPTTPYIPDHVPAGILVIADNGWVGAVRSRVAEVAVREGRAVSGANEAWGGLPRDRIDTRPGVGPCKGVFGGGHDEGGLRADDEPLMLVGVPEGCEVACSGKREGGLAGFILGAFSYDGHGARPGLSEVLAVPHADGFVGAGEGRAGALPVVFVVLEADEAVGVSVGLGGFGEAESVEDPGGAFVVVGSIAAEARVRCGRDGDGVFQVRVIAAGKSVPGVGGIIIRGGAYVVDGASRAGEEIVRGDINDKASAQIVRIFTQHEGLAVGNVLGISRPWLDFVVDD